MSEFTERCEKAIVELKAMAQDAAFTSKVVRLLGKVEGVKLALGYYNETEAAKDARIARLEAIIYAVRNGEYDNAHDITAARKFLFEAMEEYNAALAGEAQ